MKKVRIGIIGCGRICQANHIPEIKTLGRDAEITAMCDIVPGKAEARAKEFGLKPKFYKKAEDLVKDPNVDAVMICTPNSLHYPQTLLALNAGKHVLVEKPMSYDVKQADEMIDLALKKRLVLQINQSFRYIPLFNWIKQLIADGLIGKLVNCRCQRTMVNSPEVGWSPGAVWFVDPKFEGSLVGDIAVHMADCLQWLLGPVKNVQAITRNRERKVEDNVYALFDFANGGTGSIEISWCYPTGFHSFEIYGDKGTLKMNKSYNAFAFIPAGSKDPVRMYAGEDAPAHANSHRAFADAIAAGDVNAWMPGREAISLVNAIRTSNATGAVARVNARKPAPAKKAAPAKKTAKKK